MTGPAPRLRRLFYGCLSLPGFCLLCTCLLCICLPCVCPLSACLAFGAGIDDGARLYPGLYYPGVADSARAQVLTVTAGQNLTGIDFSLAPSGGRITGHVLGADGAQGTPLAGVLVVAGSGSRRVMTRSAADGSFLLTGVPAGMDLVRFATDDSLSREVHYLAEYYPGTSEASAAAAVRVQDGATTALDPVTLPPGAAIGGVIRGQDSEQGLSAATVTVISRGAGADRWSRRVTSQARYLVGGLPGGSYIVQAAPRDSLHVDEFYGGAQDVDQAAIISLAPGESFFGADIQADLGGAIWGEVRHENLAGYLGAVVQAIDLSTGRVFQGVTYGFGQYKITGLPTGSYRVYVPLLRKYYDDTRDPARARPVQVTAPDNVYTINLQGSPAADCAIPTQSQGFVTGTVRGGFPADARIVIRAFSARDTLEEEIESTGSYVLGCLTQGPYRFALMTDGAVPAVFYPNKHRLEEAQEFSVVPGDTLAGIDFRAEPGVGFTGQLSDRMGGAPLGGVRIRAREVDMGLQTSALTDSLGRFLLERIRFDHSPAIAAGLPAGRWRIEAESTYVRPIGLTPILQPSLAASTGGPGEVALSFRLGAGTAWCYLLARLAPGEPRPTGVEEIAAEQIVGRGEKPPAPSEDPLEFTDRPPGRGPFRYLLLAWQSAAGCEGTPAPLSLLRAESAEVTPGPENPADDGASGRISVAVSPVPWTGNGILRFRAGSSLREDGRLSIFSAAGVEVASREWPRNQGELSWQVRGVSGRPLSSGLYLWLVRSGSGKACSGSLLVIR